MATRPTVTPARKATAPLTPRQLCALRFVTGILAGPSGASTLLKKNGDPLVQLSRLSLKFADAFLAESEGAK